MSTNLKRRLVVSTAVISAVMVAGAGAPSALASAPMASVRVGGGQPSTTAPIAATPPMGWNSWNSFGCSVSESLIRGMADAVVSSGLKQAGYQYLVIDDCWF